MVEPPTNDDIDESSLEESLPTDTAQSPSSIWSHNFGPSEPSFGVPTDEANDETAQSRSKVRDYQPSLAERVQKQINRRKGIPTPQGRPLNWAQRSAIRQETSAKATQKVSATALRVLGKAGGRAAGVALGNVVGAAIAIALTLKDISDLFWKRIESSKVTLVVLGTLVTIFAFGIITVGLLSQSKNHDSFDFSGATTNQNIQDQQLAGLASGEYSIVSASSVADLQKVRTRLTSLLQRNTSLSSDARNRALNIIAQMSDIEKKIKTSAYASEKSETASSVKSYQKLITDFYNIVYPASGVTRQQIISMLNSGVITTTNICRGMADDDLRHWPLSPFLLQIIVEMGKLASANGFSLEVNCVVREHHKGTLHELGQAVDIQWRDDATTGKLLLFLSENRDRFQLSELIFNGSAIGRPPGYYNYNFRNFARNGRPYAGDHTGHLHVAVRQ